MTEHSDDDEATRQSIWHRRFPSIRFINSGMAIVGGVIIAVRFSGAIGGGGTPWLFIGGWVLAALGVVSIPVFRWMGKRGL